MPWDDSDDERPRRGRGHRRGVEENEEPEPPSLEVVTAAYFGDPSAVNAALRQGGDVEELDPKEGWRPLHAATFTESADVVSLLLGYKANINARGPQGRSPLHMAARDNSDEIVKILLKARADLDALDDAGKTALALATENGASRAIALLHPGDCDGQSAMAGATLPVVSGAAGIHRSALAPTALANTSLRPPQWTQDSANGLATTDAGVSAPEVAVADAGVVPSSGVGGTWFGSMVDPNNERNIDTGMEPVYAELLGQAHAEKTTD